MGYSASAEDSAASCPDSDFWRLRGSDDSGCVWGGGSASTVLWGNTAPRRWKSSNTFQNLWSEVSNKHIESAYHRNGHGQNPSSASKTKHLALEI